MEALHLPLSAAAWQMAVGAEDMPVTMNPVPSSLPPRKKKGGERLFVYHKGRLPVSPSPPPFYPSTVTALVVVPCPVLPLGCVLTHSLTRSRLPSVVADADGGLVGGSCPVPGFLSVAPSSGPCTHPRTYLAWSRRRRTGRHAGRGGWGRGQEQGTLGLIGDTLPRARAIVIAIARAITAPFFPTHAILTLLSEN